MDDNNKQGSESNEEFQTSDSETPINVIQEEKEIIRDRERKNAEDIRKQKKAEDIKKQKNRGMLYILAGFYLIYNLYIAVIAPVIKGTLDKSTIQIVIMVILGTSEF